MIVFIQESFRTATLDLGLIGLFLVGGLLLGALAYGRLGQKINKHQAIMTSFFATGIALVLFAVFVRKYPNILVSGMLSGLIGAAASPIMTSLNTLTHETMPEEARGRTFSSLEVVTHLAFLVFMFIAAYTAKYVDRIWILIAVGAIFSICGLSGILLRKERLK